ncbi:acylphosphatase [Nitrosomonas sp. Nm51]|nr:acylphosphatase [Nitrosomonas sp. Nm51]
MFRQTFIRGAQQRELAGGASNDAKDPNRVHCSLAGNAAAIDEMIEKLQAGKPVNSWQARVEALHVYGHYIELSEHQVTTDNVNRFRWSPDVEFYL